jgi:hypothetical protein
LKNKNSISCAACFNQISYESETVKGFPSLATCQNMINCFKDHLQIFSGKELLKIINDTFKDSRMTEENLKYLEIDTELETIKNYVAVKCENCYTIIGVYDSANHKYLVINCV